MQELIDVACLNSNQQMTRLHWSRSIYSCQNCFCFIMWVVLISHVNKYKHSCECDLWWKPAWTILGLWELVAITCLCFFRWAVLIFYMSNAWAFIGTAQTLRTFLRWNYEIPWLQAEFKQRQKILAVKKKFKSKTISESNLKSGFL